MTLPWPSITMTSLRPLIGQSWSCAELSRINSAVAEVKDYTLRLALIHLSLDLLGNVPCISAGRRIVVEYLTLDLVVRVLFSGHGWICSAASVRADDTKRACAHGGWASPAPITRLTASSPLE
jgi:hypothetical protein